MYYMHYYIGFHYERPKVSTYERPKVSTYRDDGGFGLLTQSILFDNCDWCKRIFCELCGDIVGSVEEGEQLFIPSTGVLSSKVGKDFIYKGHDCKCRDCDDDCKCRECDNNYCKRDVFDDRCRPCFQEDYNDLWNAKNFSTCDKCEHIFCEVCGEIVGSIEEGKQMRNYDTLCEMTGEGWFYNGHDCKCRNGNCDVNKHYRKRYIFDDRCRQCFEANPDIMPESEDIK